MNQQKPTNTDKNVPYARQILPSLLFYPMHRATPRVHDKGEKIRNSVLESLQMWNYIDVYDGESPGKEQCKS